MSGMTPVITTTKNTDKLADQEHQVFWMKHILKHLCPLISYCLDIPVLSEGILHEFADLMVIRVHGGHIFITQPPIPKLIIILF